MSLKRPTEPVETVLVGNGARDRGEDVFDQNVCIPEFSHGAGYCARIILKLMEVRRIEKWLQSPVRGSQTRQADAELVGTFGHIRFKDHDSIVDDLLACRAQDRGESRAAALVAFNIRLAGLGGSEFGARLWYFKEKPITPLRFAHWRQMHSLPGEKLLGDAEQGLRVAFDEFEFRLPDWCLSPVRRAAQ